LAAYDILHDRLDLMDRADRNRVAESIKIDGLDDPKLAEHVPADLLAKLREDLEMARELLPAFDREAFLNGSHDADLVRLGDQFVRREGADGRHRRLGPPPQPQKAQPRQVAPREDGHRLRLQGAGQHGPQAPRPRGLRAPRLGAFRAGDEADACAQRRSRWR
jgi:peptide chain release factor 3